MSWRSFATATALACGNHLVANLPTFRLRHAYYRHVLGYKLGRHCCIHMGCFFTGNFITIGPHTVINRRCYIDGRLGVEIGANCSISPEVYILSMDHDPQSPDFATCGGPTTIGDNVWIGARAIIRGGVTIGEGAVIGTGAVVTRDIAPWRIAVGNPAREIKDRNRDIRYKCSYYTWFDTDVQIGTP
jgi:acetyltransferase-like isoleucine patch superfamily enzyme